VWAFSQCLAFFDVIQACRLHMQSLTCSETMIQYLLPFLVLISCTCKVIHHRENPIITPCRDGHIKGKKTSRFFMHAVQILIYLQKREAYLSLKRNIKNLHVKAMGIKKPNSKVSSPYFGATWASFAKPYILQSHRVSPLNTIQI